MLARVCWCSTAANREIGHRDSGRKGLQKLDTLGHSQTTRYTRSPLP